MSWLKSILQVLGVEEPPMDEVELDDCGDEQPVFDQMVLKVILRDGHWVSYTVDLVNDDSHKAFDHFTNWVRRPRGPKSIQNPVYKFVHDKGFALIPLQEIQRVEVYRKPAD